MEDASQTGAGGGRSVEISPDRPAHQHIHSIYGTTYPRRLILIFYNSIDFVAVDGRSLGGPAIGR
jgi:hypothetical protein